MPLPYVLPLLTTIAGLELLPCLEKLWRDLKAGPGRQVPTSAGQALE